MDSSCWQFFSLRGGKSDRVWFVPCNPLCPQEYIPTAVDVGNCLRVEVLAYLDGNFHCMVCDISTPVEPGVPLLFFGELHTLIQCARSPFLHSDESNDHIFVNISALSRRIVCQDPQR